MKQRIALFFCCLIFCLGFPACSQEPEPKLEETYPVTAFGVKFEQPPSAVISLSPVATEMLAALGCEDRLIARTDSCGFSEALASLPSVGSGVDPDVEQLVSLQPDLILTVRPLSKQALETLSSHSIRVVTIPLANHLRELQSYYCAVACIFFGTDKGIALGNSTVQPYIERLSALQQALPEEKASFLLLSDLSGTVVTGDNFSSILLSFLGNNVAKDGVQNQYDLSTALSANPSVIFIYSPYALENLQADSVYAGTEAVSSQRVFSLDSALFERRSLACIDAVCALARELYPGSVGTGQTEPLPE